MLQDTPALSNGAGLNHTRVFFFQGCSRGGRSRAPTPPGWSEVGCGPSREPREVLGVQRGTHWGLAGSEGHSRIWRCLVGFTKVQWGQKEGGEAQQGAVGCCGEQDLFSITGAPALLRRWEEGGDEEHGWGLLGLLQTLPALSLALYLCALGVSRAEDAESNAKGSSMISTSNSILPSASSALEPHGNGPKVLILSSSSRLSRAHCPGLQAQPLCPAAGR